MITRRSQLSASRILAETEDGMKRAIAIGAALVVGVALGAAGVGFVFHPTVASEKPSAEPEATPVSQDVIPGSTGTNESGQTYGPLVDLTFESGPDLFEAYASNGKIGYVKTAELAALVAPPASPEIAAAGGQKDVYLNVYAVDGKTVIGQYRHAAGKSGGSNE